jgi:hypothetical protein
MPDLVAKALIATGWQITEQGQNRIVALKRSDSITWEKGKGLVLNGRDSQRHITSLTKRYSKEAVTWAASRAGWQVKTTGTDTMQLQRR